MTQSKSTSIPGRPFSNRTRAFVAGSSLLCLLIASPACLSGGGSSGSLYYGRVVVPREQQFKWSDGGLPQVFDPAFAAAPPDTDVVRALFEGLTDYDPRTLKPTPGVAERWESSEDAKVWTFYLRDDAKWSTGEPVTAGDFVSSWERTLRLGDLAPHTDLLSDIVGARAYVGAIRSTQASLSTPSSGSRPEPRHAKARLAGLEEVSARVLRVKLQRPNANFPSLVAHPVFRPVKVTAENENTKVTTPNLVSNGAFLLAKSETNSVLLQRADNYWGKSDVDLERVEFVKTRDSETALAAYQSGEIDAVTNAAFEPLALKLLAPYADYRRNTFAALTYYSFNVDREPFNDVRVREALAIAIDRDRIVEDELGGASEPANTFLPVDKAESNEVVVPKSASLEKDRERAKRLLAEAGYPNGEGFPVLKLLINRNEQQRQIAQAVASSWRSVLGIETEIIARVWDEYEEAIRKGEYDLARKGTVMQTADETSNIRMLFSSEVKEGSAGTTSQSTPSPQSTVSPSPGIHPVTAIETEADALRQLTAIPIYFASSYSLVKPYVKGFDNNILDAPSLKTVKIDTQYKTR